MRLIDADKLPEHKFTRESAKGSDYMRGWNDAIDAIIDNAPTIDTYTEDDVQYAIKEGHQVGYEMAKAKFERPQGKWQLHGMIYYCSECGHECGESGDNFCGNCGADMRGGRG